MAEKPNSLRTPMGRVRYLGSAKSGTREIWHQRLTSYALLPLSIIFVILILSVVGKDYNTVRATLANPVWSVLILLFLAAGIYHMQLGMKIIIEDYVHGHGAKTIALVGNMFFSICVGVACVYAVLRLSFV